jgi:hypothetical protein
LAWFSLKPIVLFTRVIFSCFFWSVMTDLCSWRQAAGSWQPPYGSAMFLAAATRCLLPAAGYIL